jgi:hypothetical protein
MKVEVSIAMVNELVVYGWSARAPETVISSLCKQLEAAKAIWPELANFRIEKRRSRSKSDRGAKGGLARAAVLSPERRSEIASEAAKARWSNG